MTPCQYCDWYNSPKRTKCYLCQKRFARHEIEAVTYLYKMSPYTIKRITLQRLHKL